MNHKASLMEGMGRGELWAAAVPQGLGGCFEGRGVSRPVPQGSDGRHAVGQMSLCVRIQPPFVREEAHVCSNTPQQPVFRNYCCCCSIETGLFSPMMVVK